MKDKKKAHVSIKSHIGFYLRLATAPWRRLPDFVVIGVQKGGTRFLYHCLSQHPNIAMANRKEVHFFDKNMERGIRWYKTFFPTSFFSKNRIVGEVTPRYIWHQLAPKRCREILPNAKIIVLLRDPINRAFSNYHMTLRNHKVEIDFDEYVKLNIANRPLEIKNGDKIKHKTIDALDRSIYSKQIQRWLDHYPREQFQFIESEALFNDPTTTLTKVYRFLDIPIVKPKDLTPKNTGKYQDRIDENTKTFLKEHFRESNDWLRAQGFDFNWLKEEGNK